MNYAKEKSEFCEFEIFSNRTNILKKLLMHFADMLLLNLYIEAYVGLDIFLFMLLAIFLLHGGFIVYVTIPCYDGLLGPHFLLLIFFLFLFDFEVFFKCSGLKGA